MRKHNYFILVILFLATINTIAETPGLEIKNLWINEAPPTVSVLAAYASLGNTSEQPYVIESVSSPDFFYIEIHRSREENDMAVMEKQASLEIPPGESILLEPGGYHLMLFEPKQSMRAGDNTTVIFHLSNGDSLPVKAIVKKNSPASHDHHHH